MEQEIMKKSEAVVALLDQEPIKELLGICGVKPEQTEAVKCSLMSWKQAVGSLADCRVQVKEVKLTRDAALTHAREHTSLLNTTARRVAAFRREVLALPKHNGKYGIAPRLRWWRALTDAVHQLPAPVKRTFTAYAMSPAALKDVSAAVGQAENNWHNWRQVVAGRKAAVAAKNKMKQQHLATYSLLKQRLRNGMKKLSHQERSLLCGILEPEVAA